VLDPLIAKQVPIGLSRQLSPGFAACGSPPTLDGVALFDQMKAPIGGTVVDARPLAANRHLSGPDGRILWFSSAADRKRWHDETNEEPNS
jgi:hypothetical protein